MKKFRFIFILLSSLFVLTDCSEPSTIEEDVAEYCQCIKEKKAQRRRRSKPCRRLSGIIQEKFKDDEEALKYLNEHQYDCIENW